MNAFILDACVAAKWFFDEEHSSKAKLLLDFLDQTHIPDFFFLEIDNILCKRIRRGEITPADGKEIRLLFREYPFHIYSFSNLLDIGYDIANRTKLSLYDCLYISLAVSLESPFITADRRLYHNSQSTPFAQYIKWIENIE